MYGWGVPSVDGAEFLLSVGDVVCFIIFNISSLPCAFFARLRVRVRSLSGGAVNVLAGRGNFLPGLGTKAGLKASGLRQAEAGGGVHGLLLCPAPGG